MRRLIRAAGLPAPAVNARTAGFEVDFLWPGERVVVEVDGYQFHCGRTAFERDRRKGLALAAAGLRVIRISWRQLVDEPLLIVAQLARALANGS
jgi:very-short-patch-repair endonuclease